MSALFTKPSALPHRALRHALISVAATSLLAATPALFATTAAHAQQEVTVSAEFRTALSPYGEWRRAARWGEVWVPAHMREGWRPYTVGHWVYSNDYGWYWNAAEQEAQWGWITYHYGRWVFERDAGWVWIPGDRWAPAWVMWRRGGHHIGWAPLPPDDVVVAVREEPRDWIFVESREFIAPNIATVILPAREEEVALRDTVIVNETVVVQNRFAVNPGIEPGIVAAVVGRPLPTFEVRPQVLAGTAPVPNAVEVSARQIQQRQVTTQTNIKQTQSTVQPVAQITSPQPLQPNERGRLGEHPPQAAQAAQGTTTGSSGSQQPQGTARTNQQGAQPNTAQPPGQPPSGQAAAPGAPGQMRGQAANQRPDQPGTGQPATGQTKGQTQEQRPGQPLSNQTRGQANEQRPGEKGLTKGQATEQRPGEKGQTQGQMNEQRMEGKGQTKGQAAEQRRGRDSPGEIQGATKGQASQRSQTAPSAASPGAGPESRTMGQSFEPNKGDRGTTQPSPTERRQPKVERVAPTQSERKTIGESPNASEPGARGRAEPSGAPHGAIEHSEPSSPQIAPHSAVPGGGAPEGHAMRNGQSEPHTVGSAPRAGAPQGPAAPHEGPRGGAPAAGGPVGGMERGHRD